MNKHLAMACGTALSLVLAGRAAEGQVTPVPSQSPASTPVSTGQTDSTSVVSVIERFHAALSAGDSTGAMALLAPDAVILESGGVETRAEYQSHHLQGDIAFAKSMKST